MTLIEVAKRLRELAVLHDLPELEELADEIPRRPPVTRAPITSRKVTPQMAEDIRLTHELHPTWSQAKIGRVFGVNAGRVSETLAGKRT